MVAQLPERPRLLVDISATGRMALDFLGHLAPAAVQGVESGRPHVAHRVLQIPRQEIVTTLSLVLGERQLRIGQQFEDAETLTRQMETYRVRPEAEDKIDLVHAAGLAVQGRDLLSARAGDGQAAQRHGRHHLGPCPGR